MNRRVQRFYFYALVLVLCGIVSYTDVVVARAVNTGNVFSTYLAMVIGTMTLAIALISVKQ